MKIKVSTLCLGFVLAVVLLKYHLLYIIPYPSRLSNYLTSPHLDVEIAVLAIFMCVLLLSRRSDKTFAQRGYLYIYAGLVAISVLVIIIWTTIAYPAQKFSNTFSTAAKFLYPFLCFPILYYCESGEGRLEKLFRILNWISLVWICLTLVQVLIYSFSGNFILDFGSYKLGGSKNGLLRIGMGALGNFFLVLNMLRLIEGGLSKKERNQTLFYCIVGWIQVILVQQTRAFTVALVICLVVILLYKRRLTKRQLRLIVTFAILAIILVRSGVVGDFVDSFSAGSEYGGSTTVRLEAYAYYWNLFLKNPLCGIGFAHETECASIMHGPLGNYYLDDVGIVGVLAQTGILIIPIYFLPVVRFLYIFIKTDSSNVLAKKIALLSFVWVVSTMSSLAITDNGRVLLLPFLIALNEYLYVNKGALYETEEDRDSGGTGIE